MLAGGAVNLAGKVTQEILQSGTYSSGLMYKNSWDNCYMVTSSHFTMCSDGKHNHGEPAGEYEDGNCEAEELSVLVVTVDIVCSNPGGGYTGSSGNESGTTPGGFNTSGGGSGNPTEPSGSNGSTNPNQPCDGNGIPSQPQDPSSTLGNQPCNNGTVTLPNLGGNLNMNEPCAQLKQINENTNITAKLTELKNNIGGSLEKGFLIRDIAGNETSDIFLGNADNTIDYPFNAASNQPYLFKTYATAHNHNKDNPKQIDVFTPEDLFPLHICGEIETMPQNPNHTLVPKKSVTFVFTEKGYFVMKITDYAKLTAFLTWYVTGPRDDVGKFINDFKSEDVYNINPLATHDELVTGFLRFMKDQDVGVELYEGDKNTFGNWRKLELVDSGNENYSFNSLPCNI